MVSVRDGTERKRLGDRERERESFTSDYRVFPVAVVDGSCWPLSTEAVGGTRKIRIFHSGMA